MLQIVVYGRAMKTSMGRDHHISPSGESHTPAISCYVNRDILGRTANKVVLYEQRRDIFPTKWAKYIEYKRSKKSILRERKLFRGFIGKVILFRQENSPLKNNSNGWSPIFNQIYLKESSAWNPGILESSRKFRCFCLIYNEITTIWHFARLWPNLRLKPHLDLHKLQHCRLTWLACMNYSKLEKVQSTSSYAANLNEP